MSLRNSRVSSPVPYTVAQQSPFANGVQNCPQVTIVPQLPSNFSTAVGSSLPPHMTQVITSSAYSSPSNRIRLASSPATRPPGSQFYAQEVVQVPILVQKEVKIVEDTQRIDSLQNQLKVISDQNKFLTSELEAFQNKPPVIQETIKVVQDNSLIEQLNSQLGDQIEENDDLKKAAIGKDIENSDLKFNLQSANSKLNCAESEKEYLQSNLNKANQEIVDLKNKLNQVVPMYNASEGKCAVLEKDLNNANDTVEHLQKAIQDLSAQNTEIMDHANDMGEKVKKSKKAGKETGNENAQLKDQLNVLGQMNSDAITENEKLKEILGNLNMEIEALKSSNNVLTQQNQICQSQIDDQNEKLKKCIPELSKCKEDNANMKNQLDTCLPRLAMLEQAFANLQNQYADAVGENNSLKSSNNVLTHQNQICQNQIDDLNEKLKKCIPELKKCQEENANYKYQLEIALPKLAALEQAFANLQSQYAKLQQQYSEVLAENNSVKSSNAVLTQQNQICQNQIDDLSEKLKKCIPELKKCQEENANYKYQLEIALPKLAALEQAFANLQTQHANLQQQFQNSVAENDSLKSSNNVLKQQNQISQSEIQKLNEILAECMPQLKKLQQDHFGCAKTINDTRAALEKCESERANLANSLSNAKIENNSLASSNAVLQQQNQICGNKIENQEQIIANLTKEYQLLKADWDKKNEQLIKILPIFQKFEADNKAYLIKIEQLTAENASIISSNNVLTHQNIISQQQIETLKANITNLQDEIKRLSKIIEENYKWQSKFEAKSLEFNELKSQFDSIVAQFKLKSDQYNDLAKQCSILQQENSKKDSMIHELQGQVNSMAFTIKQYQENNAQLEAAIVQLKESLQAAMQSIQELTAKCESYAKAVIHQENQIKQMTQMINILTSEKNDLIIEVEHLHSHEERLALLHKELEAEKILSLSKIRENDKLVNQISRLEAHLKKSQTQQPNYIFSNDVAASIDFNEEKLLNKDDVLKRSKLAIAKADSLKNSSVGVNYNPSSNYAPSNFGTVSMAK